MNVKKDKRFEVRLPQYLHNSIKAKAREYNMSASNYLRTCVEIGIEKI